MMLRNNTRLVCSAALAVAMIGFTGAWSTETSRISVKLDPCNGYCEICTEEPETYAVGPATTDPDAIFDVQVYCNEGRLGDCDFFSHCGPEAPDEIAAMLVAVKKNDMTRVAKLLEENREYIYLARERKAIHALNCKKEIGQWIALTDSQLLGLKDIAD